MEDISTLWLLILTKLINVQIFCVEVLLVEAIKNNLFGILLTCKVYK